MKWPNCQNPKSPNQSAWAPDAVPSLCHSATLPLCHFYFVTPSLRHFFAADAWCLMPDALPFSFALPLRSTSANSHSLHAEGVDVRSRGVEEIAAGDRRHPRKAITTSHIRSILRSLKDCWWPTSISRRRLILRHRRLSNTNVNHLQITPSPDAVPFCFSLVPSAKCLVPSVSLSTHYSVLGTQK
jgi:hypothetical protein